MRSGKIVVLALGLLGLAALIALYTAGGQMVRRDPAAAADPSRLPGIQMSPAPWPAERAQLAARLEAIGLPRLREEGEALHTHQHLDVFVNGSRVEVPAAIGIDAERRFISPIHTHDASGVIHVESPTVRTFTLGQFFDVWGVRFDARCVGAHCADGARTLHVYANGRRVDGDPRQLALTPHEEIVVAYGAESDVPSPIPSTFTFPEGL